MDDLHIPETLIWSGWHTNKPDTCDFIFLYAPKKAVDDHHAKSMKGWRQTANRNNFSESLKAACQEVENIKKNYAAWPLSPMVKSKSGLMGYTVYKLGDEQNG